MEFRKLLSFLVLFELKRLWYKEVDLILVNMKCPSVPHM